MRPRLPVPTRRTLTAIRLMAAFSVSLLGITCRDNPEAPRGGGRAYFAVRPVIKQHVDLSSFGLVIDSLRLVVVHAPADTLKDTTAYFNPDSTQLHLNLSLLLTAPAESLKVSAILSAGGVPIYSGTQDAIVSVGSSSSSTPIAITMTFSGPGAGVTALHIAPLDSVLHFSDSLRFRVTADSAGVPVTNFYAAWRTSDTLAARINAFGILRAPAVRKAIYVIVRTPSGAADSTPITFTPTPTVLAVQAGNNQTGTVGGPLPAPLQVRVTAADGLGVKGIPVQFTILTGGGSIGSAPVVTDTGGYASITPTFGTLAGAASYQASAAGLTAVTFSATIKPGLPTQLLVNAGAGQSVAAGALLPIAPSVVAKDTFNNAVPGAVVTFSVGGGAGHLTGATDTTNTSGVATVGSWTLDTLAHVDSLTATLGSLTRVFTATGLAGAISAARSLITLTADSVLSGTAGTITLHGRDQYGNALSTGGSVVAFTVSGGSSTGSLSGVTDHGDGTYTATFTGTLVGTSDTVHATIGGTPVTSLLPILRVVPGAVSLAQSILTAGGAIDSSGLADSVILTVKDANGNAVTSAQTVVFGKSGGTSTGSLSGTTSLGGGKYATVFTGILAGTATTINATIGGQSVTSTLPTIQVVPGAVSFANSIVTVSQGSVAVGAHSIATLLAKDAAGNSLTSGGLAVVFSLTGGTSSLSLGTPAAHDNGNGTYTDTLAALVPGTATTVHATIGGTSVTSAAPAITVVIGNLITSQSVVTVDSVTLASGDSTVVHLQAKDSSGINLTVGGLTVVFFDSGGTSTGTVGATTDHANGTYTAVFHGLLSGTATTIHATINGVTVSSTLPTVTVTAGAASPVTSVVSAPIDSIASGASVLFTIQLKDAAGNALTTPGGATVVFSTIAGTSTGTFVPSPAAYAGAGTDTARFTGVLAGTRDSVKATINATPVATAKPTMLVFPGAVSAVTSTVAVSDTVVAAGGIDTLTLTTRDAAGNLLGKGGLTVGFNISGGSSTGVIGSTSDLGNGTYRAIFTGANAGTAVSVGATIGGTPVTSALPTIRVNTTVHVSNILADSTWTAIASPHIVHGYLKIANGATLTIQPGAVVKFDTASGLQVGDTAAAQGGGLSLAGTALQPITMTTDSNGVRFGFWKGIEVQRLLAPTTWTHVLIEGAGGTRTNPVIQACLLSVNQSGAALTVDSLHVRACQNIGINLWGGTLTVRRSEVDTTQAGPGIEAVNAGILTLDSTAVRGAGNLGLLMGPPGPSGPFLANAVGNKFIGGNTDAVEIPALNLPHFGLQDSIAQNGFNAIIVDAGGTAGNPDSSVAAFTLVRQPLGAQYIVHGLLSIGSPAGQTLTLDSNLVVNFLTQSGLVIGDSTGTRQGLLKTLATGPTNGVVLTAEGSASPGSWVGLEFGRLSAPDTVRGLHIQFAGDSVPGYTARRAGILIRNPTANELVIQGAALDQNGSASSVNNAAGILITGSGGGVHIYGTNVLNTAGFGFVNQTAGVRLVGDTALGSAVSGLGVFTGLTATLAPADSIAQSRFSTSGLYPATVPLGALPAIYASTNSFTGNGRDTLLLQGGLLSGGNVTVPRVNGVPWRVITPLSVGGGGTLTFARGDTVTFDSTAAILVGDTLTGSGSLHAIAPDTAPILLEPTPGFQYWHGITYLNSVGDTSLRNVTVAGAGYFLPCPLIDCLGTTIGAIRVVGTLTSNLVFDSITVRNVGFYALQALQSGSPVVVSHGQFYQNVGPTLFQASGPALKVDSSDIYHYRISGAPAFVNTDGTSDSIVATNNWWGDVSGPGLIRFGSADSLGRTLLDTAQYGVSYLPFVTGPHFPVAAVAAVSPVADSLVFCCFVQAGVPLPDSIRVRALDFRGRGVPAVPVTWTPNGVSGSILTGQPTDSGGRAGAFWTPSTVAKLDSATASAFGVNAHFFVQVFPGPLKTVNWRYIPARTEGQVSSTLDTALFTASGHVGAILTQAADSFGNPVFPGSLYFDTLPGTGNAHNFGNVTKVTGDTIFFVDTSDVVVPFQLHGTYQGAVSQVEDSVVIETNWVPMGVRIQPDTVAFNSICPIGIPVNAFCSRPVTAQLFDSAGGAMPPNGQLGFQWSGTGPIVVDSVGGPSIMTAFVTARSAGTGTLTVSRLFGPFIPDSVAVATVIAQQVVGQIGTTPDTVSTGIGDTVTFHTIVADSGGQPLAAPPQVQWQITSQFPGLVKLDSAADSLQLRFDSGVYSFGTFNWVGVVTPFVERAPGDTVRGQGTLFNPLVYNVVGSGTSINAQSRAAVDTVTNKTFYTSSINGVVYVNDNTTNGIVGGITTGGASPIWLTVSHAGGADKVYVSNNASGTVSVIDPTTNSVSNTITLPQTTTPFGITAADPLGRVYVATRYCPGFPGLCTTEVAIMPIDVAGDSVVTADIVVLNTDSLRFPQGLAYNPNDQRLYIAMDSGYVKVVNPQTNAEVGTILVQAGMTLTDVAVNPVTDTLYVSNWTGGGIAVIDPTTATVVNSLPANTPQGINVDPLHNRIYYASSNNNTVNEIDGVNEFGHTLIVGNTGDFPQAAGVDPRTGTVYAPHFTALTVFQFYGKPVGAVLGVAPFRGAAPAALRLPTRLAPLPAPAPKPAAKPATQTRPGTRRPVPVRAKPAPSPADAKKHPLPQ